MWIGVLFGPFGTQVAQFRIGVGEVNQNAFDIAGKRAGNHAFTLLGHRIQNTRFDLQVPAIVSFTRFQHGAGRRGGIAATLHHNFGKVRFIGNTIILIGGKDNHVIGTEFLDLVGASPNRHRILIGTSLRSRT